MTFSLWVDVPPSLHITTLNSLTSGVIDAELAVETAAARTGLILSVPALQARALHLLFDSQRQLAGALQRVCPEDLGIIEASAMIGAVVGAAKLAGLAGVDRGDPPERVLAGVRHAVDIAVRGLRSIDRPVAARQP
jgi:hypothetical protein